VPILDFYLLPLSMSNEVQSRRNGTVSSAVFFFCAIMRTGAAQPVRKRFTKGRSREASQRRTGKKKGCCGIL